MNEQQSVQAFPIVQLEIDEINVRKIGRGADPALENSIEKRGQLYPMLGRRRGQKVSIFDGGKRLASMLSLQKQGKLPADATANVIIITATDDEALVMSTTSNAVRAGMHPLDLQDAFASHIKIKMTPDDIGVLYAMPVWKVTRILALAALSPKIRDAWRMGKLSPDAAQKFTIEPNQREQDRVFDKLSKGVSTIAPDAILRELKADNNELAAMIEFVGVDAYEKAGGKLGRDLFGMNHRVLTPHLAKKMADEKIAAECDRLTKDGWLWATPEATAPQGAEYSWPKLTSTGKASKEEQAEIDRLLEIYHDFDSPEEKQDVAGAQADQLQQIIKLRGFDEKAKAKSGVIVSIDRNGKLKYILGILRPSEAKAEKKAQAAKTPGKATKKPELSNRLAQEMSEALTLAAGDVLAKHPAVALAAILAGFAAQDSVVHVSESGLEERPGGYVGHYGNFEKVFAGYLKKPQAEQLKVLATIAASALNFSSGDPMIIKDKGVAALCSELPYSELHGAILDHFDAKSYFGGVTKDQLLTAIAESIGAQQAKAMQESKRSELQSYAIKHVAATDWLPPELRPAGYKITPKKK